MPSEYHKEKEVVSLSSKHTKIIFFVALFFFISALSGYAFVGPSSGQSGGSGSGLIGVGGGGVNLSIGTSTTASNTLLYLRPKTSDGTNRNLLFIENGSGTPVLTVVNDVVPLVGVATSNPAYTLSVEGDLQVTGFIINDNPLMTTMPADRVTPGVFDSHCGSPPCDGASYAFPTGISLAVGTSSNVGIPSPFTVYGNTSITGNLSVGTTSVQTTLNVNGRIRSVSSGTTPTTGTGVEIYYSNPTSTIVSVARPSGNFQKLEITGDPIVLSGTLGDFFRADSVGTTTRVMIGSSSIASSNLDINGEMRLIPSYPNGAGLPVSTSGAMYYDSGLNRFRCHEGGSWRDCIASSSIVGGGQTNYVAKWLSSNTLGTSTITDTGTVVTFNLPNSSGSYLRVMNGSFYASGTIGATPVSGAGTRMMWVPARAAFRAGVAAGNEWDNARIGASSVAMGYNVAASGTYSVALGSNNIAGVTSSVAIGESNTVYGAFGAAIGSTNSVNGSYSFAAGTSNTVSGGAGAALGSQNSVSNSYGIAAGYGNNVAGNTGVALGYQNSANGSYSTALGGNMTVSGINSFGINLDRTISQTVSANNVMAVMGGNVGIGLINPAYTLQVNGTAAKTGGGAWTNPSDARLKNILGVYRDGLSVIDKINPIIFRYNGLGGISSSTEYVGVIAQDIKDIPELEKYTLGSYKTKLNESDKEETTLYTFNPSTLTFTMINAIKEQQKEIENLENQFEMKDRGTGDVYCISIVNGNFTKTRGSCPE